MKKLNLHHISTEKLSQRILYILIGVVVLVFALFYLIGYDMPYSENPDFNEPLLTNVLLIGMYLLLLVGIVVGLWAMWREIKMREGEQNVVNGIPETLISRCVTGGTFIILVATFALASTHSIISNGKNFTDKFSLRIADQFINTSVILLLVAIAVAIYGMTKYRRKQKR